MQPYSTRWIEATTGYQILWCDAPACFAFDWAEWSPWLCDVSLERGRKLLDAAEREIRVPGMLAMGIWFAEPQAATMYPLPSGALRSVGGFRVRELSVCAADELSRVRR